MINEEDCTKLCRRCVNVSEDEFGNIKCKKTDEIPQFTDTCDNFSEIPLNAADEESIVETNEYVNQEDLLKKARRNIIAGLIWCIGGILVTYLTYYFAKPGASYTVAYGAIIYGAIQAVGGWGDYLGYTKKQEDNTKHRKVLLYGILGIIGVIILAIGGWKFSHKDDFKPLSKEQIVKYDPTGISFTIPSKYEKVKFYEQAETDSSYLYVKWSSVGENSMIIVEEIDGKIPASISIIDEYEEELFSSVSDYCTGNFIKGPSFVELEGKRFYKYIAPSTIGDGFVSIVYNLIDDRSLITTEVLYLPPKKTNTDPTTLVSSLTAMEEIADRFVSGIELAEHRTNNDGLFLGDLSNLSPNERTDGLIVFSIPEGYSCEKEAIDDLTAFYLKNEYSTFTVLGSYDSDKTKKNFVEYWNGWKSEDISIATSIVEKEESRLISDGISTINGNDYFYRVAEIHDDETAYYWRFVLLFNDKTGKVCVISGFDSSDDSYIEKFLESIRFIYRND